jgi:hypothetical protein
MKLARPLIAFAAVLAFAACNEKVDPVPRATLGPLSVETSSDKDTLVTGDTALITFRFNNPSDTTITLTSGALSPTDGKPCPVLIPVAAYPGTTTVYSFILSTCFGGADTTLTGQLQLQNISIPAHGTIERTVPFTGFTRASAASSPRCLATGKQWILPLFLVDNQFILPIGAEETDGPELLYLKPPATGTTPCTTSTT